MKRCLGILLALTLMCGQLSAPALAEQDTVVSIAVENAQLAEADGVVIGSPVYVSGPNGTLISYLDRLFYSTHFDKRMKVGTAVVSARRNGTTATFEMLNQFFFSSGMPAVAIGNWNAVHGYTPEDVLADEEGLAGLRVVAENMVFLMKSIAKGKEEFGMPAPPVRVKTNYIR